jgi:membrane-associated protease RseP (regulator of RpoE activity)
MKRSLGIHVFAFLVLALTCPLAMAGWGWHRGCFGLAINAEFENALPTPIEKSQRVARVWRGLPADQAGIRVGDEIIEVDGRPVETTKATDLVSLEWKHTGETLTLKLAHPDGETYVVSMVAVDPPWWWNPKKPSRLYVPL